MLGYVVKAPKKKVEGNPNALTIPADIRHRVKDWVNVDEVGSEGFWLWLGAVLPLLPPPGTVGSDARSSERSASERVRELARDLVDLARDRARLTVECERYYHDNQALARRVKALEGALKTFEKAGRAAPLPADPDAEEAGERYLPST
ncbi:MAG TPA: hypothetical protein VMC82_04010 [Thermoplasmata archaeon]|nr:hypothetical protein [Thermoplasmata archaeon]